MSKVIVVTGASDGIGAAGARQLHKAGHAVVIVGRSAEKTQAVAGELGGDHFLADFTSFEAVRNLAADLDAAYPRIDVLVNNAGGVFGDQNRTIDGFEKTLQVNHLAPFLLTNLLMDKLLSSRASVIQTSSNGARLFGGIDIDDLNNDNKYTPHKAYGDTKLANILFTKELHARFHGRGLSAAAFHPGAIATSFASDTTSFMRFVYGNPIGKLFLQSPDKGARQLVWLAEGTPGADWQSGAYYENKKPATKNNPQANDADLARRLWDRSAELAGMA
ncbi:SDR family NAD(P)-dependent oxidoreductase [Actinacidiphila oryziradicis]|uniref:SDR family NAD(P)-dependent oxidoreductase n=1 Tax=Actinacidiphila oryziradicis TaxID=2571141 RepID=A0A4U0RIX6_9ACTN|nr:SDR family NAD(P)-dependent oxidoreductase [Actinacidiphila oryziradicis]TJZ95495.1 SDR family NAD(P)-dependent oxidoreductase [Actinacidiphila oryziradicis]